MAGFEGHIGDHGSWRRRALAGALACGLLILAACGFGTTEAVNPAEVTHDSALLHGTAHNTEASAITHWFEYGSTEAYGTSTPVEAAEIVDPAVGLPVQAMVSGLEPSTTYHFRLCVKDADNHGVCSYDRTFTTAEDPTPPVCAATFPGPTPYALGNGAEVTVSADCGAPADPISFVCFDFTFGDNALDPQETLMLRIPGDPGFGFSNVGTTPQDGRTICGRNAAVAAAFASGAASFAIDLDPGTSLTIARLEVRIVTAPAA